MLHPSMVLTKKSSYDHHQQIDNYNYSINHNGNNDNHKYIGQQDNASQHHHQYLSRSNHPPLTSASNGPPNSDATVAMNSQHLQHHQELKPYSGAMYNNSTYSGDYINSVNNSYNTISSLNQNSISSLVSNHNSWNNIIDDPLQHLDQYSNVSIVSEGSYIQQQHTTTKAGNKSGFLSPVHAPKTPTSSHSKYKPPVEFVSSIDSLDSTSYYGGGTNRSNNHHSSSSSTIHNNHQHLININHNMNQFNSHPYNNENSNSNNTATNHNIGDDGGDSDGSIHHSYGNHVKVIKGNDKQHVNINNNLNYQHDNIYIYDHQHTTTTGSSSQVRNVKAIAKLRQQNHGDDQNISNNMSYHTDRMLNINSTNKTNNNYSANNNNNHYSANNNNDSNGNNSSSHSKIQALQLMQRKVTAIDYNNQPYTASNQASLLPRSSSSPLPKSSNFQQTIFDHDDHSHRSGVVIKAYRSRSHHPNYDGVEHSTGPLPIEGSTTDVRSKIVYVDDDDYDGGDADDRDNKDDDGDDNEAGDNDDDCDGAVLSARNNAGVVADGEGNKIANDKIIVKKKKKVKRKKKVLAAAHTAGVLPLHKATAGGGVVIGNHHLHSIKKRLLK